MAFRSISNEKVVNDAKADEARSMKDILNRLQKMKDDAEDCALISRLATDPHKRKTFAKLAEDYRAMIVTLETSIGEARDDSSAQS